MSLETISIKKKIVKGKNNSSEHKPILLSGKINLQSKIKSEEPHSKISDSIFRNYTNIINRLKLNKLNNENSIICLINELLLLEIIKCSNDDPINNEFLKYSHLERELLNKVNFGNFELEKIATKLSVNVTSSDIAFILNALNKIDIPKIVSLHYQDLNKIFGQVFERIITKKEIGAYYTGQNTTNYIVENTIFPCIILSWSKTDKNLATYLINYESTHKISLVEDTIKLNNSFFEILSDLISKFDKDKLIEVIKKIKIIDISCGSGSFIFGAYYLFKKINDLIYLNCLALNNHNYFNENLFGIDIDEEAINILNFRIIVESVIVKKTLISLDNIHRNFKVANSLLRNDTKAKAVADKSKKSLIETKIFNIISSGGFDVVIGNPPYLEYKKSKVDYEIINYKSVKCNNLYAFILERNFEILREGGFMGMIVPISFISTKRMSPIRNLLFDNSKYAFCSNFGDRPSCLFNGVHQKLNIILIEKQTENPSKNIYTSSYIHWYAEDKDSIFNSITYTINDFNVKDFEFKIGNEIEESIIRKLCFSSKISLLNNTIANSPHKVWLNMRMTFWSKSFIKPKFSNEYKIFNLKNEHDSILFSALMNSNIFFFYWETISDVWHITLKELNFLKIDFSKFNSEEKTSIRKVYLEFENNLEKKKKRINSKQAEFEYQHKKDKILIDKIDLFFKKYFKFTDIEMEYIRNYQLKFRLNEELNEYLKKYKS